MIDQVFSLTNVLSESNLIARLKILLNVILIGSLSSLLFEAVYFEYELIPLTDFQGYYNFFINGDFIVPLILFVLCWYVTDFLASVSMDLPNEIVKNKLNNWVNRLSIKSIAIFDDIDPDTSTSAAKQIPNPAGNWLMETLGEVDKSIDRNKLPKLVMRSRRKFHQNFELIFRLLIVITIYFNTVAHFNWLLYIISIVLLLFTTLMNSVCYQMVEIIHVAIWKSDQLRKTRSLITP
jgi:hypothetical protein